MSLARLLEQATPPLRIAGIPPGVISASDWDVTDEVLETWPDMARLLIDMAAMLALPVDEVEEGDCAELLSRFAVLDGQAKDTT